jgi:metacaspase-1
MAVRQGLSLHIGLNDVDATKYNGWPGTLAGCENDANAMQAIAIAQGFTATQLITAEATADALMAQIGQAAHTLQSGDTFIISFSGHGALVPDATGTSPDGMDDAWAVYDRMVLGHELYNLWSQFAPSVHIEVYSDSCHSGTVIRDLVVAGPPAEPLGSPLVVPSVRTISARGRDRAKKAFETVYRAAPDTVDRSRPDLIDPMQSRGRSIPTTLAMELYNQDRTRYEALQWSNSRAIPTATVILISGCQDNQSSLDGLTNGLFTEKLLNVWAHGTFQGTIPQFHKAIVALMPPEQTPNYFSVGPDDPIFTNARPLSIVLAGSTLGPAQPTAVRPEVHGPANAARNGTPPTFSVTRGTNPYYVFEITNDPGNFGGLERRTTSNFYGSWADPAVSPRLSAPTFSLTPAAWDAIKGNAVLYYRVGSTTSSDPRQWENYLVSVTDGDAPMSAPSITLQ